MADNQSTKQTKKKRNPADHLKSYQWKKGQTGNAKGRPKGKTLKTFAREYLMSLSDDEKIEYLKTLPGDIVWRMAEGNPETSPAVQLKVELPEPLLKNVRDHNSDRKAIEAHEEDQSDSGRD